nr:HAD-IC family P-type ATPase [Terrisporobacter hibernicus]
MGVVGIMTNVIALWMIFCPYEKNKFVSKIPLFKVFSIGYIPSHKNSFASGMAYFIDNELLSGNRVVNSFELQKNNFKNHIISNIKDSNYMVIVDFVRNKKHSLAQKTYGTILKLVKKNNNRICNSIGNRLLDIECGRFVSIDFVNNKANNLIEIISQREDKIIGYLEEKLKTNKSLQDVLPEELITTVNNKIEKQINDYINKNMENSYVEDIVKNIIFRNEKTYNYIMDKSIKDIISEKSLLSIQNSVKTDKFINITLLNLKDQLNSYLQDYLGTEFQEEKKFDELLGGKIKEKLDNNIYNITDVASKKLISYIKDNDELISSMVVKIVRKNLNFFVKMAYDFADGDGLVKDVVNIVINNKIENLSEEIRNEIIKANKDMADRALRVLCSAIRYYEEIPKDITSEALENNLIFVGLTGMIDPVREEVVDAIKECNSAGIRPIMITGDHKDTAVAIAMELGIIKDGSEAITGAMLNEISDEEFEKDIEKYSVYARVQPEHKVRIVNTWKKIGKISAMTGDGVNDAPAIKSADIGVGMGATGTDVTKNVSDMVLADDNFATIVHAVEEGRRIYDNIRKSIQFLLSSNLSEVVAIFFATLVGFIILKPVHLLWINLITDCFPALALGTEKAEDDIMKRSPRNSKESIFAGGVSIDIIWQGFMIAIITIVAYVVGHYMESGVWEFVNSADGMTMAFLTMSRAEIFHSFNLRSRRGSVFTIKSHNKFLWGAMILSLLLTLAVIYIPFLSNAFGLESISIIEYGVSLVISFTVIPIVEIVKFFQRRYESK